MAEAPKALPFLLILNLLLYGIVTIIAGWVVNYGIEHSHEIASTTLKVPAHIFPIYYPIGNTATGFFVIFALIAGLVGVATSVSGINSILQWSVPNSLSAATYSTTTWLLTILAMGLACKEINIGITDAKLRTLEVLTIILSATQLLSVGVSHVGVTDAMKEQKYGGGGV